MKIAAPFDLWRAGSDAGLTAWQMQIALGERMLAGMTAWQRVVREPLPTATESPAPFGAPCR